MSQEHSPPNDPAALLEARYQALELTLVEAATAALGGSSLPTGLPKVSAETALKLLALRGSVGTLGGSADFADFEGARQRLSARILAVRHVAATRAAPTLPDTSE